MSNVVSTAVPSFARLDGRGISVRSSPHGVHTSGTAPDPGEVPTESPEPPVVVDLRADFVDSGVLLSWSGTQTARRGPVLGYRVTAFRGGEQVRTDHVGAHVSAVVVGELDIGATYRFEVGVLGSPGEGEPAVTDSVTVRESPLRRETAESLAKAYLRADARLLTTAAGPAGQAVAGLNLDQDEAAGIGAALDAVAESRSALRERLAEQGVAYVEAKIDIAESAVQLTGDQGRVVLHLVANETLRQDPPSADTDYHGVQRYSFVLVASAQGAWAVEAVTRSNGFAAPFDFTADESAGAAGAEPPQPAERGGSNAEDVQPAANAQAIVNYAHRWYAGFNPDYTTYGNDCTNFASQSAAAGGLRYISGWYRSDEAWWYNLLNATYSWAGAHNFWNHLWKTRRGTFRRYVADSRPGDIVFWDFNGDGHIDHVSIINANRGGHLFYTQHTDPVWNKPLAAGLDGKPNAKVYIARISG